MACCSDAGGKPLAEPSAAGAGLCPPEAPATGDWSTMERRAVVYRGALDAALRVCLTGD
jgi:hypothetical protein